MYNNYVLTLSPSSSSSPLSSAKTSEPMLKKIKKLVKKHLLILKDCKPGRPVFQRFGATMVFYLFSLYLMSVLVVTAGLRYPRGGDALPDIGFEILPAAHNEHIPNNILLISILASLLRFLFHRKGLTIMRRFMAIHGITALLRCVTLVTTSYPDPSLVCRGYHSPDTPTLFWKSTLMSNLAMSCGDLMPSGHTLFFISLAMIWHYYTSFYEKCAFWVLALAGSLSLIITRLHYTNDVLIAIYVALTTFYIFHIYAIDPNYRDKNFVFSWLEADLEEDNTAKQLVDRVNLVCTV